MPAELPEWVPAARRAVGDRIRVRRLHQNLTQESLAHTAGIDRSTIQRMEAGHEMKLRLTLCGYTSSTSCTARHRCGRFLTGVEAPSQQETDPDGKWVTAPISGTPLNC